MMYLLKLHRNQGFYGEIMTWDDESYGLFIYLITGYKILTAVKKRSFQPLHITIIRANIPSNPLNAYLSVRRSVNNKLCIYSKENIQFHFISYQPTMHYCIGLDAAQL